MVLFGPHVLALVLAALVGVYILWRWARRYRAARLAACGLWLVLTLASAQSFYERFWIWRDCFDVEGRCYDSEAGVMVAQAGPIWGGLMVLCASLLFINLLGLRSRSRPRPSA